MSQDCSGSHYMAPSRASQHRDGCQPLCSECYLTRFVRPGPGETRLRGRHDKACDLRGLGIYERWLASYLHQGRRRVQVCRLCSEVPEVALAKVLQEVDAEETKRLATNQL